MTHPLRGQFAVVTGADSGIGRSAVEMLLRAGAHVTMICRFREPGERARAALLDMSAGREAPGGSASKPAAPRVALEIADLSKLESVRLVDDRVAARLPAIDILVNNAGIYRTRRILSADGFELTFATNYLGHFLLTSLLLECLAAGRGRTCGPRRPRVPWPGTPGRGVTELRRSASTRRRRQREIITAYSVGSRSL